MEEAPELDLVQVRARCASRASLLLRLSDMNLSCPKQARLAARLQRVVGCEEADRLILAAHLADLAHWCDEHGHEFDHALRLAEAHYVDEAGAEGMQMFHSAEVSELKAYNQPFDGADLEVRQ